MAGSLILISNPGSASRKYALYDSDLIERARLHFEITDDVVKCSLHCKEKVTSVDVSLDSLEEAALHVESILKQNQVLLDDETIAHIGLRIVAPSEFFMRDHIIDQAVIEKLESLRSFAPIHVSATLDELKFLHEHYNTATIVGVSDSAFHATKPSYAWNYGINIHDADRLDIKRFGYHGLSVAASVDALWNAGKLPPKVIVCHLGSGSSVTGVFHRRSIDTTMGYTPLEGVIMASRSGSIDAGAVKALKLGLGLNDDEIENYLYTQSGLLGIGGTDDIRELISREADGDHYAHLALTTLIHTIHKAIGSMLVAMNGCDLLVFTGTVGERSAIIRKRIVAHLEFVDFMLDGDENEACTAPKKLTSISQAAKSRPIIIIPTNESLEIARHVAKQTAE